MKAGNSPLRSRLRAFIPLLAVTLVASGWSVLLFAENSALRRELLAARETRGQEAVYARTAEEARARILEELAREGKVPDPIDQAELQWLGLCQSGLTDAERTALKTSFTSKYIWTPELVAAWSGSPDLGAELEQARKVIGPERHREIAATCKLADEAQLKENREIALTILGAYLGLSQSLTEQIRALQEEKAAIMAALEPPPGTTFPGLQGPNEAEQKKLAVLAEQQRSSTEKLNQRFRELLGPEQWKRYKLAVISSEEGDNLPILYWLQSDLFSPPDDEVRKDTAGVPE
jgi:hypothetical protein